MIQLPQATQPLTCRSFFYLSHFPASHARATPSQGPARTRANGNNLVVLNLRLYTSPFLHRPPTALESLPSHLVQSLCPILKARRKSPWTDPSLAYHRRQTDKPTDKHLSSHRHRQPFRKRKPGEQSKSDGQRPEKTAQQASFGIAIANPHPP